MQRRHDYLNGRSVLSRMHIDRDTAAVVSDRHNTILVDHHLDHCAIAGKRFIDTIVDYLVDQMVQSVNIGATDVHRRSSANGFQTLQNLNPFCGIFLAHSRPRV